MITKTKPKWCNHIKFWSRPETEVDGEIFPACSGWTFLTNYCLSTSKWKFCPICGVKRK